MTASPAPRSRLDGAVLDGPDAAAPDSVNSADLIITSLRPAHGSDHASDRVALVAARLLRVGGVLAVLTHCDWPLGELIDPTGAVVASAQNADLLYLQHIIALHVPVRGGRFATESLTDADTAIDTATHSAAAEEQARAAHRAAVRGLPAPHRRVHSDVLVFAQPQQRRSSAIARDRQDSRRFLNRRTRHAINPSRDAGSWAALADLHQLTRRCEGGGRGAVAA